ncbi:non-hydrolyzing UDP-N-acetylglucosamine 2-epimerase [Picosynechococcus sp. PCC 7117]|uniref:non-hydrolyzing UDP-N-acetylglucosamine 2-epimerase n=1 Tax=Picosynechococcus sp. PCC 7117 TaxID=195498 RepID=UPI000810752A|nr:UDP-N-acetylglucosamine 2-epimerase (non-hydrolyzing) [Picosynechococcus sp. PCC 7117]ANV86368.1 UDP-N-acetylglucosamine 2-epimerase [Picosynechococcus sp. PCC 7117]
MKTVTIVGARPQFIKAATVSRLIQNTPGLKEILVHTGQHYDENMSAIFFEEMEIPAPHYHLGIGSGSHGTQTGQMLSAIEAVLIREQPDWVLIYGDTNSTLAGALAAAKLHLPIAHVEAGLHSFNKKMPEEINRILADRISDLLFAPTETAVANLHHEGIRADQIALVGDVMYDAALYYGEKAESRSQILQTLQLQPRNYLLATIHRAENTDNPQRLQAIFGVLSEIAKQIPVVLPLHPRTRKALEKTDLFASLTQALSIIEPVGYLDMVMLEKNARLTITDSGGVQKEAFFYGVPCVTLREETEWVELVELGWNYLLPPVDQATMQEQLQQRFEAVPPPLDTTKPYGDGKAAQLIVHHLLS